jgi:hypothetical protein
MHMHMHMHVHVHVHMHMHMHMHMHVHALTDELRVQRAAVCRRQFPGVVLRPEARPLHAELTPALDEPLIGDALHLVVGVVPGGRLCCEVLLGP